jgi:hypothetical protein
MSDIRESQGAPGWFTAAAIGVLVWELVGGAMLAIQMLTDPAALPVDQRAIWEATPIWMTAAWWVAVLSGLAGAILLLMRRVLAERLLLLSFVAVAVQFSGLLIVTELRNLVASDDLFLPFLIILVCYGLWMFSRRARKAGWLH